MRHLFSAFLLAAFSNISALTPAKPTPDLISGSVTDGRADDAEEDDLVYASIKVDANSLVRFEVEFKRSSFVFGSSTASFFLDTDQNGFYGLSGS